MAQRFSFISRSGNPRLSQKGVVLIFLAFILGLGAAAYLLKTFNAARLQSSQAAKTTRALNEAKKALISWTVADRYSPGQMPWPDRNGDLNYDGSSDCVVGAGTFQYSFLLGQLPRLPTTSPCLDPNNGLSVYAGLSSYAGLGQDFRDAEGNRLWYAVSRNLVRDYENSENPIINPGMINAPHAITPYLRQGGTQSYPWLKVLDRNGNLVSDRVAAVIISPGSPIGGQDRSASAPNPTEFLDSFQIGAKVINNRGYATADEDFVIGEDSRNVSASDTTFTKPYNFNDKLVFITIDELMAALEQRAANEIKNALLNYYEPVSTDRPNGRGIGSFPYAARLGSNKEYACVQTNVAGVLPISTTMSTNFTCSYNRAGSTVSASCSTGFSDINSITFQRNNNFTASSGACSFSGKVCTCTGAGLCSRAAQNFTCLSSGSCLANSTGSVSFSGGEFTARTGKCDFPAGSSTSCVDMSCSGTGAGTATRTACTDPVFNMGGSSLPSWIINNRWYEYFYYVNSRSGLPLTVGTKPNVDALLVGTGSPIIAPYIASKGVDQLRPSCNLNDHLDSSENTNADVVFDAINKGRTQNYNDHSYIVAP